jgi:hypothetical protein
VTHTSNVPAVHQMKTDDILTSGVVFEARSAPRSYRPPLADVRDSKGQSGFGASPEVARSPLRGPENLRRLAEVCEKQSCWITPHCRSDSRCLLANLVRVKMTAAGAAGYIVQRGL